MLVRSPVRNVKHSSRGNIDETGKFNSGWLFCYGSGTALERTVSGTQTVILAPLTYSDEE